MNNSEAWSLYNLNGEYSKLEGIVSHVDGATTNNCTMDFYLDGVLSQSIDLTYDMIPQKFTIDLTNITQLKIHINGHYNTRTSDTTTYGIGNPTLYK